MSAKMTIDIWTDLMCPFCFIGKKNLDSALLQFYDRDSLAIEWHSYLLAPDFHPRSKKNGPKILAEYKGVSLDKAKAMSVYVTQMAQQAGIQFDLDRLQWADTLQAHRLLQWSKPLGSAYSLEQRLFEAVFCYGENIGDVRTLLRIVEEIGLPVQDAFSVLKGNDFTDAVKKDMRHSLTIGMRSLPFFLVDNKFTFSGAAQPTDFLQIISDNYTEWRNDNPPFFSSTGTDGPLSS
ncbi:DsbA family oxidoreductase [Flavobacterium sp. GCM10023249]|uniref:DsbA family oxidoreductase n=1 Tax=unclassified Flavobacterium TaxID=196869 RepID=UPI0036178368